MSLIVSIKFPRHPLSSVLTQHLSRAMKPDYLHVIWAVNDCSRPFSLLGSRFFFFFFSLTSSQNYRQEIESRIGARGCVCFVAKGVLWRQQVGLWIPSPARRHEAHAQEASPAKYSWPPSPPLPALHLQVCTLWAEQRTDSESSLLFLPSANSPSLHSCEF